MDYSKPFSNEEYLRGLATPNEPKPFITKEEYQKRYNAAIDNNDNALAYEIKREAGYAGYILGLSPGKYKW